jgi:hypothetical protein
MGTGRRHQPEPPLTSAVSIHETGGPPGIRTQNLRIKRLAEPGSVSPSCAQTACVRDRVDVLTSAGVAARFAARMRAARNTVGPVPYRECRATRPRLGDTEWAISEPGPSALARAHRRPYRAAMRQPESVRRCSRRLPRPCGLHAQIGAEMSPRHVLVVLACAHGEVRLCVPVERGVPDELRCSPGGAIGRGSGGPSVCDGCRRLLNEPGALRELVNDLTRRGWSEHVKAGAVRISCVGAGSARRAG